jgi:hypothetical protein
MTEEQKDCCPEVLNPGFFDDDDDCLVVLHCEKPAGHRGVHEAEGIEWWDSK